MGTGPSGGEPPAMPCSTASDERLVALVRLGRDDAFAAIVRRHRPRLEAFARSLLRGAHHDAEEVVQDALLRALHALRADDRPIALSAWLHAIVRNRCLDVLRRPQRSSPLEQHELFLRDATADPHDRLVRRESLDRLVHDLGELPARQREALVRHELGGESHGTIGRRLDVSVSGSKALVHRARLGLTELREAA
jgi:RNA polymerase sigma-70 factor, ECF subfamily